jgi:hypothetical protein
MTVVENTERRRSLESSQHDILRRCDTVLYEYVRVPGVAVGVEYGQVLVCAFEEPEQPVSVRMRAETMLPMLTG